MLSMGVEVAGEQDRLDKNRGAIRYGYTINRYAVHCSLCCTAVIEKGERYEQL